MNTSSQYCRVKRQVIAREELTRVTCRPGTCVLDAGPFTDQCMKCGAVTPIAN